MRTRRHDSVRLWKRASRCAGWMVRDVPGHLAAGEDYHRACLDGTVAAFLVGFAGRGGTDLDSVNALGVAGYAALSPAQVLARWADACGRLPGDPRRPPGHHRNRGQGRYPAPGPRTAQRTRR
jgi:hypothetical protein